MADEMAVRAHSYRTAAVLDTPQSQALLRESLRRETPAMNLLIVDDEQVIREMCTEVAEQLAMKALAVATVNANHGSAKNILYQ